MANLINYTLNNTDGYASGDYDITMEFDDNSTSTQTIHFGVLVDEDSRTVKQQLDDSVLAYAQAYQNGLDIAPIIPNGLANIVGQQQEIS